VLHAHFVLCSRKWPYHLQNGPHTAKEEANMELSPTRALTHRSYERLTSTIKCNCRPDRRSQQVGSFHWLLHRRKHHTSCSAHQSFSYRKASGPRWGKRFRRQPRYKLLFFPGWNCSSTSTVAAMGLQDPAAYIPTCCPGNLLLRSIDYSVAFQMPRRH
jgi:hypothetical protein